MLTFVKFSNKQLPTILTFDFPLVPYKVLLFETRKNSQSLQAIWIHSVVGRAPVRVLSPGRGRKILTYFSNLITFSKKCKKNWPFHQTYVHPQLLPHNFPGHARYLIRKLHIFSEFWTILSKICWLDQKICSLLWNFPINSYRPFWLSISLLFHIKYYSSRRERILSLYKPFEFIQWWGVLPSGC